MSASAWAVLVVAGFFAGAVGLGALWCWWDMRRPVAPAFELYDLTGDIPGHPAGSTVSRATIEAAGYRVPKTMPAAEEDEIYGDTL